MDTTALVFSKPPATSSALAFGADDASSTVIADNPPHIGLTLREQALHGAPAWAMALPGPVVAASGLWDANVSLPTVGKTANSYQHASHSLLKRQTTA